MLVGRATIFMLHRFKVLDEGVEGHDPGALRNTLELLRRHDFQLLSLHEVFRRLADESGKPLRNAVCFTVDDGYFEQAEVGGQIFAEFDCPATIFTTSGFLDGELWFWWDQVEFIVMQTELPVVKVELPDGPIELSPGTEDARVEARRFVHRCKQLTTADVRSAVSLLSEAADIRLPFEPPHRYRPMSWTALRRLEARGIRFGPHTVTHPILARSEAENSEWEIRESWKRLQTEASDPDPIFCYPNGGPDDFGQRELDVLKQLGFAGAVTGTPGYAIADRFRKDPDYRFRVPRYVYSDERDGMIQLISGLERVKQILRGGRT
ncbi:MAG: polysaccharide deacetylase family protein [Anaerolineales bacterium]|nr:polysaccharide deacetylase family protein [Anaerolineales bacterium]